MNITSDISLNSSMATSNTFDNQIQLFVRLRQQLQERIEKVKKSDRDPRAKEDMIRNLQEQIEQIDARIQQTKMEKMRKTFNQEEQKEVKKEKNDNKEEVSNCELETAHLTSAVGNYSQLENMKRVRTQLVGEARIASSSGENPEAAQGIMDKIHDLEGEMAKKIKSIDEDLKKSSESQEKINKDRKDMKDDLSKTTDESDTKYTESKDQALKDLKADKDQGIDIRI